MKNVVLSNIDHANLKINAVYKKDAGFDFNICSVFPNEYSTLQGDYPIFYKKDNQTSNYQTVAILGFEENENLYLGEGVWLSKYVPLSVQRLPFYIGKKTVLKEGVPTDEKLLQIDIEHPSISEDSGNEVFFKHGGNTEYLDHINNILSTIDKFNEVSSDFLQIISNMNLLRPLNLKIDFSADHSHELSGLYVVDEEKLKDLEKEDLFTLHQKGYLQYIYLIAASVINLNKLISLKKKILNNGI